MAKNGDKNGAKTRKLHKGRNKSKMPTLTGPDGAVYAAAATAPSEKSSGAASKPNSKNNAKEPPSDSTPSRPAPASAGRSPPAPPPAATEIQLKMWHAVLLRRRRQIQRLPHSYFLSFANDIISDLSRTRHEANEYSNELKIKKKHDSKGGSKIDLGAGHYKSFLLTSQTPPTDLSADEVGLHLLALFYRSMDARLPNAMRKHGIDSLRRACKKLEFWISKWEAGEKISNILEVTKASEGGTSSWKKKRKRRDSAQKDGKNSSQCESRAENASHRSNDSEDGSNKRMRTDSPELNDNSAMRVSGITPRIGKVFLHPQPQGDSGGNNDSIEGGKFEKGEHKDPPQVSASEQRPEKVFLPPQPHNDKSSDRSSHVSASKQINSNHAVPAQQQQSAAETQQRHPDEQDKSKEKERKDRPQPKQNNAGVSKESGCGKSLGNRFMSRQPPQQGRNETSKENGSARSLSSSNSTFQRTNSKNPLPPQQGSATTMQNMPQQKDPPERKKKSGISQVSASKLRTETALHGRSSGGQHTPPQGNSLSPQVSFPSSNNLASQRLNGNAMTPPKQRAEATARNEPVGNNERQGNAIKSSNPGVEKASKPKTLNAATSNANNENTTPSSQACTTSQRETHSISTNRKNDDNNTYNVAKKVAITAPRPSAESRTKLPPAPNAKDTEIGQESDGDDDDVIDLTGDTPMKESPRTMNSPSEAATNVPSTSNQATKQCEEENTGRNKAVPQVPPTPPPPPRPPSPPASPLPLATIHTPRPSPQPKPKPFFETRSILFHAEGNPTASGSLKGRTSCLLSFDAGYHLDGSGSCLDDELCIDVSERLVTWDPYWKIVEELGISSVLPATSLRGHGMARKTSVGTRTAPCMPAHQASPVNPDHPSSCASVYVDLPTAVLRSKLSNRDSSGKLLPQGYRPWGVRWGSLAHPYKDERGRERESLQTGDRRLIVRTLPLQRTDTKKRADGHLWPKGTFLQVKQESMERVVSILQRKQQSHAHSEWKGISHPLDLTLEIKTANRPIELKLCSKEIVENSGSNVGAAKGTLMGSYALHVAICEFVAPDDLYEQLMGKAGGGDVSLPKISLRSARKMAKEYLANQTVLLDDSDDDGNDSKSDQGKNLKEEKSLTFSLICPISKTAMQTPVRGRNCKHMQCMDLRNFLHANKNVTGGRWRCGVCEAFVNVRELVHCGLFQAMLDALGSQVSGARDRVSLRSDGNWRLMDENRLRYNKRGGSVSTATKVEANNVDSGGKRLLLEPEVIELA